MENNRNSYETMFIVSLANGEEAAQATVAKFTDLIAKNAEVVQIDDWGKRRMAYPIQDMTEGYYTVATYKCDGAFPAELEQENVLCNSRYCEAFSRKNASARAVSAIGTPPRPQTSSIEACNARAIIVERCASLLLSLYPA